MNTPARRVRVQITRAREGYETFHGLVLAETTSHYRVQWLQANDTVSDEWFAKDGRQVQCVLLDEGLNPLNPLL